MTVKRGPEEKEARAQVPVPVRGELRQSLATLAVCITAACVAAVWSFTATALPSLRVSGEISGLTQMAEDWIGGSQFVGALVASLVGGLVSQKKGHRFTMLLFLPFLLLGWMLVMAAQNLGMIIIGRIICGFSAAAAAVPPPTFIAEISDNSIRGKLGFYYDLFFCVGVLYINIFGAFLSWRLQAVVCSILPIIAFIAIFPLRESPRKILEINLENKEKAKKALMFYTETEDPTEPKLVEEFEMIVESVRGTRQEMQNSDALGAEPETEPLPLPKLSFFKKHQQNLNLNPQTLKRISVCIMLQFYLQMSGEIPIVGYTVDIFTGAGTLGFLNEYYATIIVGFTNLIMTIVASYFVDKYGRRWLLMGSQFFCGFALGILATYLFVKEKANPEDFDQLSWIPLTALILFMTAFSFGVGPMPWVIMGEVVPENARGLVSGIANMTNRFIGFFPMFFFKDLSIVIGQYGAFMIFSLINFSGVLYVWFCIPETNGIDLTKISLAFDNSVGCLLSSESRRKRRGLGENGIAGETVQIQSVQADELAEEIMPLDEGKPIGESETKF